MRGSPRYSLLIAVAIQFGACESRPINHVVSGSSGASEATTGTGSGDGASSAITNVTSSSTEATDPTQGASCGDGIPDVDVYCHVPNTTETFAGRKVIGDINGDGHVDLAFLGKNDTISLWRGTGMGTPEPAQTLVFSSSLIGTPALFIADFDADLLKDLITITSDSIWVCLNEGGGVLAPPQNFPPPAYVFPSSVANLNDDERVDLVAGSLEPQIQAFINIGGGAFDLVSTTIIPGCYVNTLVALDVDGDARADVIAVGGCNNPPTTISAQVLKGTNGGLSLLSEVKMGSNPMHIASGDIDADNDDDIAVTNVGSGKIQIYTNNGAGVFNEATVVSPCPTCPGLRKSLLSDLDGDGRQDELLAIMDDSDKKSTLFVTMDPIGNPDTSFDVALSFDSLALGDFNEDGIDDVALSQTSPLGQLMFLLSNP